jgi:hypothetical protein
MSHLAHQAFPFDHGERSISHWKTKIRERKRSLLAIESICHSSLLFLRGSHDNDLALEEIDLKTRENFESNQKEFQINYRVIIQLDK